MTGVKQFIFNGPLVEAEVPGYKKASQDSEQVEVIFKNLLTGLPFTLSSYTVTAQDSAGADVTSTLIGPTSLDGANGRVFLVIKGGVSGGHYIIFIDGVTSEHPDWRAAIRVQVQDLIA